MARAARRWTPLLALVLAAAPLTGCSSEAPPDTPRRNLLLISVDSLRADHLGTYGYDRRTSPQIDRFFESAVVFEDAHSAASWTLPSFSSLMTSLYSTSHGCWQYDSALDPSFKTLAEILSDAGYRTAAVVSHVFLSSPYGLNQGFHRYDESLVYSVEESHRAISSSPITQVASTFLDERAAEPDGGPWFLWVHYFDPHFVYRRHEGITGRFGRGRLDRYDGEIAYTDEFIGRLLAKLEGLGMADATVVAFVSDHGEEFRDHGRSGHGKTLFHEVMRIPMAIRSPDFAPRRVSEPVGAVDFLPTILEVLGVPAPPTPMAGRSLVPLMRGERTPTAGLLLESRLERRKDVDLAGFILGRWKLIVETPKDPAKGDRRRVMLFDRDEDPHEQDDLSKRHPDIVEWMTARLEEAVSAARAAGSAFTVAEDQRLSADEMEQLRELGYIDEEEDATGPGGGEP